MTKIDSRKFKSAIRNSKVLDTSYNLSNELANLHKNSKTSYFQQNDTPQVKILKGQDKIRLNLSD